MNDQVEEQITEKEDFPEVPEFIPEQRLEEEQKPQTVEEIEKANKPKRKGGRPPKKRYDRDVRITRETRIPLGGFRDKLTVANKDPNFHYYWELDLGEKGTKIARALQAGYVFVKAEEEPVIAEAAVYTAQDVGNIIRVAAGGGMYHYLLKIPKEWREEDQARVQERVNQTEQSMLGKPAGNFYGGISIDRH